MRAFTWIGRPVPRRDALEKVKGVMRFPTDLHMPGMLYAMTHRSKYPHARIKRIDVSKAERVPGVVAILTHEDVPGRNRQGIFVKDRPILADDKVRYIGDPIALVAAETKEAAEEAVKLIEVEYEPLPGVFDPIEAMKPDAPKVHDKGNIARQTRIRRGDVEAAFKRAAAIVENTYYTHPVAHAFLEPEAGLAYPDEQGRIVVVAGGQSAYRDKHEICESLDLPPDMVRVINPPTGGAFGGKDDVTLQTHLALLVMKTRRPVKLVWSREESMRAGFKRHPGIITMKTAADSDGNLIAHKVKIIYDTGAYASLGPAVLDVAIENCPGPYRIPNIDIEAYLVYTNNHVAGAFRGFGAPQVIFAMEQQMDMLAEKLGMDKVEFRLRNALRRGDVAAFGNRIETSIAIDKCLEAALNHPLWRNREEFKKTVDRPWLKRGVGVASAIKGFTIGAIPDKGEVELELREDGRFVVKSGVVEMGQGVSIVLAQIAAEALRCDINDVEVVLSDTSLTPDTSVTSASRATFLAGNALLDAIKKMEERLRTEAGEILGESPGDLELRDGHVVSKKSGRRVPYRELAGRLAAKGSNRVRGVFEVPVVKPIEGSLEIPHLYFMLGVALALVEVNTLTGFTRVLKLVEIIDAGRVINPIGFEGQVEGGAIQGLGYALMEESKIEQGYLRNPELSTYLIPTAPDIPEIEVIPIEYPEESGPFGAKGIGEISLIPVAPAIINAIYDATGVRLNKLPASPENVYWALKKAGKTYRRT